MFGGRQWSYISFCEHVARRRLFGLVCVDRTKRPLSALRWEGPRGGGFPPKEKPHHALCPRKNHITLSIQGKTTSRYWLSMEFFLTPFDPVDAMEADLVSVFGALLRFRRSLHTTLV
jgi:hypothetical protein